MLRQQPFTEVTRKVENTAIELSDQIKFDVELWV
jgi:hypothetical protein